MSTLARLYVTVAGLFTSYFLMLAEVPRLAARHGPLLAGATTSALMLSAVVASTSASALLRRIPAKPLLICSVLLSGLPVLAYEVVSSPTGLLVLTAARGFGFGLGAVVASTTVSTVAEHSERSRAMGTLGIVSSAPGVFSPAAGLLLAQDLAPIAAFATSAAVAALACVTVARGPALPRPTSANAKLTADERGDPTLWLLAAAFLPVCFAYAAIFSFLPLVAGHHTAVALLAFGSAYASARWVLGRLMDQWTDHTAALPIASIITGLGVVGIALSRSGVQVLFALVMGAGVGLAATGSLVTMLRRSSPAHYGSSNALWGTTFNLGVAGGGLGFGSVAATAGSRPALLLAAAVIFAVSVPIGLVDWRRPG